MITQNFKDLFSEQASEYAKFRPTYPPELFAYLASISKRKTLAWDCGTGNGQAALELTKYFNHVVATDPSEKQISQAPLHSKISYEVVSAENFKSLEPIDLITVAQAFHWFDHKAFAEVVKKVSSPYAHLAVWSYAIASVSPAVDLAVERLYSGVLGSYWEKERHLVEEGYKSIVMPFTEIEAPHFQMQAQWTFEQLIGYLGTWSALQIYINRNQINPLHAEFENLRNAWGDSAVQVVQWPLSLRVWKI
ncbi:MAG: class I SAM-dependent methyltransferase [Bacteriovorax sp.]